MSVCVGIALPIYRVRESIHKWQQAHPESAKASAHRRRAHAIANTPKGEHYTMADVKLQYKSQKGKCWHCGVKLNDVYHIDHFVPLAKGGTNSANNIVVSCPKCNLSKNDKTVPQWKGRLF